MREIGFDYLRDNLRHSRSDMVQGGLQVAIVDEADHALVDDGRTPLIISGKPSGSIRSVFRVKSAVEGLIDDQKRIVASLVDGLSDTESTPSIERYAKLFLADPRNAAIVAAAARDARLLGRVRDLIDTYSEDGIENKLTEGLLYTTDLRRDLVALTSQGSSYVESRLGPVFDTADLHAEIAEIDADRTVSLVHQMLRAYLLLARDEDYIVADGRVVLIDDLTGRRKSDSKYQYGLQAALEAKEGVRVRPDPRALAYLTVEGLVRQYDHVSGMTGTALEARETFRRSYGLDVAHNRLDAVRNGDEARIVQEAGSFGAVTVATNMAGRGTDILLGDDLDERVTGRFIRMLSERLSTDYTAVSRRLSSNDVEDSQSLVKQVQSSIEQDAEAVRIVSYDLARIIERQTLNYYKARNAVLDDEAFGETCHEMARDVVRRLVEGLLPATAMGDYQGRFDDLLESVRIDFSLDIEDLRGLGAESLHEEISGAVITRFGNAATTLGTRKYNRLAKTMALQASDGLWAHHLDLVQD
ncbi:Protein translocase subunit SecA [Geodia barretti]|uniref:Protein translocase subunit SecA n=1 Tax=Geodia barretti TaxID=519541 RepID=A0AA35RA15_GEOBA|nr:Protein translocase subunit SecA [Geodia barretti]